MSNAIQTIADRMLYLWEDAISKPVKMIRIVVKSGDESMLAAFYDYMLALDSEESDMVFVIELPFVSADTFAREVVAFVSEQVNYWNTSEKPEDIVFEPIDWKPDDTLTDKHNPAALAVANFNRLTELMVADTDLKCSFVFDITGTTDFNECQSWFKEALALSYHPQMVWGVADIKTEKYFDQLASEYPDTLLSIYPDIDMNGATEQLAEQAVAAESSDPASAKFRLALIRLMKSVKQQDASQTEKSAKECLDIALQNVQNDVNWLSQFVTVYTILYTDQIGRGDIQRALYFADRAVEASKLAEGRLDPSLAYRLLGNALLGKAGIPVRQSKWQDAAELYQSSADAYGACNDYLMRAEALRMSGWCWDKISAGTRSADCYIEGFRLIDHLSEDLIKNSSYPLLLLNLLNNTERSKSLNNDEVNKTLTKALGKDWERFLYDYKLKLGKHHDWVR